MLNANAVYDLMAVLQESHALPCKLFYVSDSNVYPFKRAVTSVYYRSIPFTVWAPEKQGLYFFWTIV